VVISRKPDLEGREPTAAQLAARERFRQAALYGKMVTHARARCARVVDPETKAIYAEVARAKGQPMFSPNTFQISAVGRVAKRIETTARPRSSGLRCKSRSLGLDTALRDLLGQRSLSYLKGIGCRPACQK
jgi:hypothetical protein